MQRNLLLTTLLICLVIPSFSQISQTKVSIKGEDFYINNKVTLEGKSYQSMDLEGLLPNSRMVQGIFDDRNPETRDLWKYPDTGKWDPDRNTREFLEAMPLWRANGLLAFTINMQGGSPQGYSQEQPWHNSGFNADGSLDSAYLRRLEKIIHKANELGMVVIVGYFYFGQDERLQDEAAVINAVRNLTEWLLQTRNLNILVEVNNECDIRYNHPILTETRVHELISLVKSIKLKGRGLPVSTSFAGGNIPSDSVLKVSDFILLHANGVDEAGQMEKMVEIVRERSNYRGQPIVFNEDDHYDFEKPENNFLTATKVGASWGYFDYRMNNEPFEDGYQSVPVDWGINSARKKGFFNLLKTMTD